MTKILPFFWCMTTVLLSLLWPPYLIITGNLMLHILLVLFEQRWSQTGNTLEIQPAMFERATKWRHLARNWRKARGYWTAEYKLREDRLNVYIHCAESCIIYSVAIKELLHANGVPAGSVLLWWPVLFNSSILICDASILYCTLKKVLKVAGFVDDH